MERFVKKMLKFVMLKGVNHSTTTRNYALTYYKTLEEVPWHLGQKKLKKLTKIFKKFDRNCEN